MNDNEYETPVKPARKRYLSSTEKVRSVQKRATLIDISQFMLPAEKDLEMDAKASSQSATDQKDPQQASKAADPNQDSMALILSKLSKLDVIDNKLTGIESDIRDMNTSMAGYKKSLEFTQNQLAEACEEVLSLKEKVKDIHRLEYNIDMLKLKNKQLEEKALAQEVYSRRENIVIDGVPESKLENCLNTVNELFQKLTVGPLPIQRCHRLGRAANPQGRPRRIIVRFISYMDKRKVMENRGKLRGTNVFINDDFPQEIEQRRSALRPVLNQVKKEDPSASLYQDKLRVKGQLYTTDTVKNIPMNLSSLGKKESDDKLCFGGQYTPLSNFYKCQILHDNITFPSSEHMYQFQRSAALGRHDVAVKVLAADTALSAMYVGREARATDDWTETEGVKIMSDVINTKMEQVPAFAKELKKYAGKTFAEATTNSLWGTGVPLASPNALNVASWKGKNLLGKIYDKVVKI